jgi:hypothetical protein
MNLIAIITRLHKVSPLPLHLGPTVTILRTRLETLIQEPIIIPDHLSGPLSTARIIRTAELYRLAALVYLHTTIIPLPRSSPELQCIIQQSLSLMEEIGLCTSPWPLFVTALEVNIEKDRIRVLNILETMQRVRRIGNVDVLQRVVEAVWKRADLDSEKDTAREERVDWRHLFDMSQRMPSFI